MAKRSIVEGDIATDDGSTTVVPASADLGTFAAVASSVLASVGSSVPSVVTVVDSTADDDDDERGAAAATGDGINDNRAIVSGDIVILSRFATSDSTDFRDFCLGTVSCVHGGPSSLSIFFFGFPQFFPLHFLSFTP